VDLACSADAEIAQHEKSNQKWHFSSVTITGQFQQVNWQLFLCIM